MTDSAGLHRYPPIVRSLRLRLLFYTSIASVIILSLLCVGVYAFLRGFMLAEFNQALLTKARAVAATAEQHGNQIIFDFAPDELPKFVTKDHPDYFEAWIDPDIVIRSPSLGSADIPRPPGGSGEISYSNLVLPDGRRGRVVSMSFTTTIEPNAEGNSATAERPRKVLLSVATESEALHAMLENMQWILVLACGLAVALSGGVLMWVSGRAVRPVERLARDIDLLHENDLSARLAAPDAPLELQPVVDKLNDLLIRMANAFSREKAFTADVAHELRTPLAAILTTFDVCRSRARDEAGYVAAIDKARDVALRMQSMVESLLILARADAGQLVLKHQSIDAADLLDESWAMFAPRAEERCLKLEWKVPSSLQLRTDPEKLRIIFQNLFDNACSYANANGAIRVAVQLSAGQFQLEVANTGSRIAPADIDRLFERFWRGDQARADTGVHCGLGLSLCQRLARLLDGRIEVQTSTNDWFTVRLTLPAACSAPMVAPAPRSNVPAVAPAGAEP
jgi:two-component system sensor histidine kinase QseC